MSVQNAQLIEVLSDIIGKLASGKLVVDKAEMNCEHATVKTVSFYPFDQPQKVKLGPAVVELNLRMLAYGEL